METIEFRRVSRSTPVEVGAALEYLVDGVPFLELVRAAELPDARAEQAERAQEFAPEPAPLLAGNYAYPTDLSWRHLLGEAPDRVPCNADDDAYLLLGCDCGIEECWALTAKITTTESTVTWSHFANNHRAWDYTSLGVLTFARRPYEQSLRTALDARVPD
ncbi:MAG: hypothetical protein HOV68_33870 [Streptomycetaceae bacterium]|nr:hypothetical protein [Streptomycetaceae bacterium]